MNNWFFYCGVVVLVVYCPGPMTMFSLANGISLSRVAAIAGIFGGTCAYIIQILITYFSLGLMVRHANLPFHFIKVIGAAYFFWLAYKQFSSSGLDLRARGKGGDQDQVGATFAKGFLIAMTNPKSIVFFAALFPQFIQSHAAYALQFLTLGLTYLVIQFSSGLIYMRFGARLVGFLQKSGQPKRHANVMGSALALVGLALLI